MEKEKSGLTEKIMITRITGSHSLTETSDVVLKEKSFELYINGSLFKKTVLTEGNEKYWVLGTLRSCGRLRSAEEAIALTVGRERAELRLERPPLAEPEAVELSRVKISSALIERAITELATAELYRGTGCLHVASLYNEQGTKLFMAEDISRHNAVDKAIGWFTEEGLAPSELLLFISGRMPLDMVMKLLFAGLSFIASVSAPTLESVLAARKAGITMAGFVRDGRMNIYSGAERITAPAALRSS